LHATTNESNDGRNGEEKDMVSFLFHLLGRERVDDYNKRPFIQVVEY